MTASAQPVSVKKSEDRQTKATFQAQATPWMIKLAIPREDIIDDLNAIWEAEKKNIKPAQWRGFRPGSDAIRPKWEHDRTLEQLYLPAWSEALRVAAASQKQYILDINQLSVVYDESATSYNLVAIVYYMPKIHYTKEITEIPVEIYELTPELVNVSVENQIARMVVSQQKFHPVEKELAEGDKVVIKMETQLDGKPWPQGSNDSARATVKPGNIRPDELRMALIGKKKGDVFTVECPALNSDWGQNKDKAWKCTVSIKDTLALVDEPRDEYFKRVGYDSEEAARASIGKEALEQMEEAREGNKKQIALHHLRMNSTAEPIPMGFLRTQAAIQYEATRKQDAKLSDADFHRKFGVKDKNSLIANLIPQIADKIRDEIAVLGLAEAAGKLDFSKPSEENYVEAEKFFFESWKVSEVKPLSERPPVEQAPTAGQA